MGTVSIDLPPGAASFPSSAFAVPWMVDGVGGPVPSLLFDAAADEAAYFSFPAIAYGSGNLSVAIDWYSFAGSISGAVSWEASIMAQTPGDAEAVDAASFAATASATTTVNATAKGLNRTTVTIAGLDSIAAGDRVRLKVARDADGAGDTMAGDAALIAVTVSYSDA